jgi:putative phosphoesterase
MKVAIVSDTHGNMANFRKAVDWIKKENISVILHAGDIGSLESLKESLAGFEGEFFGVFGNMDKYYKISGVKIEEEILEREIDGKKIAITHKPEDAKKLAESGKYDLVFYGHTHKPWEERVGSCRMINPGELAGQFYKPSFAVFDTATNKLELKILEKL